MFVLPVWAFMACYTVNITCCTSVSILRLLPFLVFNTYPLIRHNNGKAALVRAMLAYRGRRGRLIAPINLNLNIRWKWASNVTLRPLFPSKEPRDPFIRGWVGSRAHMDVSEKISLVLSGIRTPDRPPRSPVTVSALRHLSITFLYIFTSNCSTKSVLAICLTLHQMP